MKWRIPLLVMALLGALYAFCGVMRFAWLAATPLTPERYQRVIFDYHVWGAVFLLLSILAILLTVSAIQFWKRQKERRRERS